MPLLNLLLEAVQRVVAFFDRRRGLLVVLLAAAVMVGAGTVKVLRRPPVLTPAVDGAAGGLMNVISQPLKISRLFTRSRGPAQRAMESQLDLERLREAERENVRLREMLGYEPPTGFRTLPGRVIGLDLDPLRGIAWVNLGYNRGLLGGEPVTTVRGLVGVVDQVESLQSRVRLLRNEDTPVSVRVARSRVLGIVVWDPGASRLKITMVPLHADMVPGDTLLTSGLGGVFPPGLLVGVVSDIEESPDRLLKEAVLRPFGTFFRLEEVFILQPGLGPSWPAVRFGASVPPAADDMSGFAADSAGAPGDSAAADSAARREAPPSLPPPPDDEMGPWIPRPSADKDFL